MSSSVRQTRKLDRCLIAADLHLDASEGSRRGFDKLLSFAKQKECELFLLGDLFHYWFGRRHLSLPMFKHELTRLQVATQAGLKLCIIPGNRDFLLDRCFEQATGCKVGGDDLELILPGLRVHCSHGDLFSTWDLNYLRMRRVLRSWPIRLLSRHLPTFAVNRFAVKLRAHSERVVRKKTANTLEPDREAVRALIAEGYSWIICGHYHRYLREPQPAGGMFHILEPYEEQGYVLEIASGELVEHRLLCTERK